MRTGASAVCYAGSATEECNSAEIRFIYGDDERFERNIQFCIANNVYIIANYCLYEKPFSSSRLNQMMTIMYTNGCNKNNSRITVNNEPMRRITKKAYAQQINQVYQQVNKKFYVGAGNEEFGLAGARGNMYQYILDNCTFDYLDIHIQSTMIDSENDWRVVEDRVHYWLNQSKQWAHTYGKKLSCTEANWSKIKTANGHSDLMMERDLAKQYGCEDFNIVFINGHHSDYVWLSYLYNGAQNSPYWNDLRNRMLNEAPEEEVFELYGIEINYVKPGSHNEETRAIQQIMIDEGYNLEPFGADSWYGDITEAAIRQWQGDNGLTVDGIVGKNTWQWIFEHIDTGILCFLQMIVRTARYK